MGIFLRRGPAPHRIRLYDKAEGSIIKIAESGTPVEFYIAKHDYEPGINETGRTLMVRKDCYDNRAWGSTSVANYAECEIDSWLNGDYYNLLDTGIRSKIGKTTFYYILGNGDITIRTLQRAVFLLSVRELGDTVYEAGGTALPIADVLKIAHLNGATNTQWTRIPNANNNSGASRYIKATGSASGTRRTNTCGSRPCFTLPSDMILTDDMLA